MHNSLKKLFHILVFTITTIALPITFAGNGVPPCGNNGGPTTHANDNLGAPPPAGDPFNPYSGNEYKEINDLKIWGGVGEHQLIWKRWANSRYVNGTQYFGNGHNWRHNYQWDFANAGTTSTGQTQYEIIYPDGTDNIFTQSTGSLSSFSSPLGVPDVLTQKNQDFYLQRQNGWVYHFTQNKDTAGNVYFQMVDFKDSEQNDYQLAYNAAHEVIQVTEPGGRYFQINYGMLTANSIPFTTFATVQTVPPSGQYTSIPVTDPHAYRFLRFVGADFGADNVAEVEFYDTKGNKLTGTPFGNTPAEAPSLGFANAFDGNVNTYVSSAQQSGGYCGIDLGPGNSAVIGMVRFYPRIGAENRMVSTPWMASGHSQFQGSNQAPVSIPVITSVTTNDGRIITYNYSSFADSTLPYNYEVLSSVSYDDQTVATYTYQQIFPSTQPLVVSYNDPRNEKSFTKSKTAYFNIEESALGQVNQQINYDTGEVLYTLQAYQGNLSIPAVTQGNGGTTLYIINHSTGQNTGVTDAVGNTTSYSYDSYGYKNVVTDALGRKYQYVNSPYANPLQETRPDGSAVKWTRDGLDLPLTSTDSLGRTTTWTRDNLHRVTGVLYPDGSREAFAYNSFGQVLTHTQKNGATESFAYDSTGLLNSKTDAQGNATIYSHDPAGRLAKVTDARGNATSYQYNAKGQVTQSVFPDGSRRTTTYDVYGNKLAQTDELGHTTTFAYDTFNRKTSATDPLGRKTQWVFRSSYFTYVPDAVVLPSGKTVANVYDLEDHLVQTTSGYKTADAATTALAYDPVYNLVKAVDPKGGVGSFTYDSRNRKASATDPLNHVSQYTYDSESNLLQVTRPDGGITRNSYNAVNRLVQTTDPKNQTTSYTYDLSSNVLSIADPKGNIYANTYDRLNRKLQFIYPDKSSESWAYDSVGNVTSLTTRAGQVKTSTYDSRNREIAYVWSDATPGVKRSYDLAGRLLSSANGVSTSSYAYDSANQCLSETQTNANLGQAWKIGYAYDLDGNQNMVTYPSGVAVARGYTNRNQVSLIAANGASVAQYTYDLNGNVSSKALANGTLASYTLDADNNVTVVNHTNAGGSYSRFDYGYDVMNRRTFEQRNLQKGDVYSYDPVDQVAGVKYETTNPASSPSATDRAVSYSYDPAGNRTAVVDSKTGTTNYGSNGLNQYTSVGGASYGYDNNGNLGSGNGIYLYNAQNRLLTARVGSNVDQFAYDSRNRVVEREVNGQISYLIYDGWELIEERSASGALLATYIHGVQQDELLCRIEGTSTVYYDHNALGSVVDLTGANGMIIEKYKYDVFGTPAISDGGGNPLTVSAYGNRFLFTGREYLAEVNLYDYRNRVYNAALGRFLQTDPLRFDAGDINIYRYCANNTINLLDKNGTSTFSVGFSGGAAWGGAGVTGFANVAFDSSGNVGITYGGGGGPAVGAGLSGGVSFQSSNAATIQDLKGPFANQSVSGADGTAATADTFEGDGNSDSGSTDVIGAGVTVGIGLGGSAFDGITDTFMGPSSNFGDIGKSLWSMISGGAGSVSGGGGGDTPGTNTDPGVYDNPGSNYEPSGSPKDPNVHDKGCRK